ncbi:MAG: COG1355, Predicted dioxygenase [uncultured Rubrobacteraceae bacterium]|uniref:COG1355, Predicted dioxygenase n=1 Tax=uncultured Rubrobacteraceae bacterium TaxID=349277 RepID=A0A6J4R5T0_9ACTN|nr:MAG: COG1355, Predicted dioxygenase [uncultured Rubrobacteraceae bacterium]
MTVREVQRLFTIEEYHRMAEAGILHEDDRVELIEEKIIQMAAIGSRHAACVKRLIKLLVREVGDSGVVGAQDRVFSPVAQSPNPILPSFIHVTTSTRRAILLPGTFCY